MIEIHAGQPVHGGYTLCRMDDGRVVLVEGAIPGERVLCEVDESQRPWRGKVVEVLEASEHRREPLMATGGAELSYMSDEAQVDWKTAVIRDSISHLGGTLADHLEARSLLPSVCSVGPGTGTRTRIDLDATDAGELAMHARGTNDLVPVTSLPLADPRIVDFIDAWSGPWPAGKRIRLLAPSGQDAVMFDGDQVYLADGRAVSRKVTEKARGYTWKVRAGGFWQTHVRAPEVLIEAVLLGTRLRSSDRVAEFYGGAGLFTQPLADKAAEVRMWEGDAGAVADAIRNVPRALIQRDSINASILASGSVGADVVVADPSRDGLGVKGARALATSGASAIALLSCDPAAMARDVGEMVKAGRVVMSMDAIDLFPNTMHVEVVTILG